MKKELQEFIHQLGKEGKYPESVLESLNAHLGEGSPETIVDSIVYDEPNRQIELMFQIVLKFALTDKK